MLLVRALGLSAKSPNQSSQKYLKIKIQKITFPMHKLKFLIQKLKNSIELKDPNSSRDPPSGRNCKAKAVMIGRKMKGMAL